MKDKSALSMVIDRKSIADDARDDYAQRAVDCEKLYHNYIDETTHPYFSNIALPWPYIITESYLGKAIQMLAAFLPYVRIVEEDDDSRPKAKKIEKDVNMTFYRQKWPIFAYNMYKQAFKFPCAFVWRKWADETVKFNLMNWFKVWVNPYILSLDDDDAYLIYETFMPKKMLKRFEGHPDFKNFAKVEIHSGDIYESWEREIFGFKNIPDKRFDPYSEMVKVWYYFSHDDFIMVTNENNVIRNDGNGDTFGIPVDVIKPIPVENEFYGMSILEEGKGLFSEANENRNQFNDAVNLMLNPQWVITNSSDIKKSTIISKPGNIIYTDDVDGAKPWPVDWNILPQSINRHSLIENDIQNYSNAFPQMRGAPAQSQGTATGDLLIKSAGELRSDTYNLLLSMMSIEAMAEHIVDMKRQMMIDPSSQYYWPEGKINTATPEDYAGNFSFKSFAGFKQTQEIERKQLLEALTMVSTNPMFAPLIAQKANEWLERLLDSFPSIRSPEQLYVSDEEMAQQQMQQFIQAMITGQATGMGGGGESPALGEKAMRQPESSPNPMMTPMISNMMGNG